MNLIELAERCEAATGPDRALDYEIEPLIVVKGQEPPFGVAIPPYTASVDAALTLVPEGWRFIVDSDGCHCRMTRTSHEGRDVTGFASTIALAICAAALRAKASEQNNG